MPDSIPAWYLRRVAVLTLPLVTLHKLSAFIPGHERRELVLRDINLDIHPGCHICLFGENGSGKSSLLRLIHGDLWPCSGSIRWQDKDGAMDDSRITARRRTALVSPLAQDMLRQTGSDVFVHEWLTRDFSLDPLPFGSDEACMQKAARYWLSRLDALSLWHMPLQTLSQGQMRLCLLVRAFLRKPSLLLLDEYADGLDEAHVNKVLQCLDRLKDSTTMFIVAHRRSQIPSWCQTQLKMKAGRLALTGTCPEAHAITRITVHREAAQGRSLFKLVNATVYMGKNAILKNIDWQCAAGEHWRISGSNGSGKSTFLRLLAGDEMVDVGGYAKMYDPLTGMPVMTLTEKRRLVSMVSDLQQAAYPYDISALELVCSGFENSMGIYREFTSAERNQAMRAIAFFFRDENAGELANVSIRRLSSGQLRRLFLARALVSEPCVLLLDEPFSMLDGESRIKTTAFLEELGTKGWERGRPAIIFVSHHPEDLPACVGREAEIRAGVLRILR